ncbi:histidine kinase [Paenibacillus sp. HN-1]|uniref:sensor histidine kinase n=1 Tax=Paenibacillus TaxID=44249 RepID=UPI001CA9EFE7|nr:MULTISPECIES: histidine kinase [Paenibacillus]MBY9078345.1 histidine kinase [Paenibacillus sp. CGMCC 1.18879]MBY9083157.1 histidine kinase [Paenibacillus sinensis]
MASGKRWFNFQTIRARLIIGVLILTLPIIGILIYNNLYAIGVVRNQVAHSYSQMTQLYMNQIDNNLEAIDIYMNNIVALNQEFISMAQTDSEDIYRISKVLLSNTMTNDINMYSTAKSFIVYDKKRDDFLEVNNDLSNYDLQIKINDFIREQAIVRTQQNDYRSLGWVFKEINGKYYLFHTMKYSELYLSAVVEANKLTIPLSLLQLGDRGGVLLTDLNGKPITNAQLAQSNQLSIHPEQTDYYLSGKERKFLIIGKQSRHGSFLLNVIIPDEVILQNLPHMKRVFYLFPLLALLLIPIGLYFLRRTVLIPLNRLLLAMKRIRSGILEAQIQKAPSTNEFQMVNETFNGMVAEIRQLKIDVYEEQISKQKEELLRLQLQMNPHFFMNSLTILYNMAKVNKTGLLMEMTLCLIQHFRFIFRSNHSYVLLKDEIEHTLNYLRIQELRFPGCISVSVHIPDFLQDTPVPPLMIQTFIENTIKHAINLEEPIGIVIKADLAELETLPYLVINIEDTGKGYPEHILEAINKGESIVNENGEHTGIWNIQRRLRLLYGKSGIIRFSNRNPHGAAVEILLPLEDDKNRGDESDVQPNDCR